MKNTEGRARIKGIKTPEYLAYQMARQRCVNPKNKQYKDYGGRGIKFLFKNFRELFSAVGPRPSSKYSLDRRDNNGNYEVGNTKWSTRSEQQKNKRPFGKGYYWSTTLQKWTADIIRRGVRTFIGSFEKEEDVKTAVEKARKELV